MCDCVYAHVCTEGRAWHLRRGLEVLLGWPLSWEQSTRHPASFPLAKVCQKQDSSFLAKVCRKQDPSCGPGRERGVLTARASPWSPQAVTCPRMSLRESGDGERWGCLVWRRGRRMWVPVGGLPRVVPGWESVDHCFRPGQGQHVQLHRALPTCKTLEGSCLPCPPS